MQYLDESDTRLKLALQAANISMWEWNSLTGKVVWSHDFEQLFGVAPGRLERTYRGLLKRVVQADRRVVFRAIARAIRQRSNYTIEFRIYSADGSIRWLASQGEVDYDADSHPIKITGLCRDITLDKHEKAPRRHEEIHKLALSNLTPDALFLLSEEGVFLDFRPGENVQLVKPPVDFIGKSISSVMPPELAQRFQQYLIQTLTTNQTQIFEYSLGLFGKPQHFEARLVRSGSREVLAIIRNITERKETEAALRLSEQRLNGLINSLQDIVWSQAVDTFELLYLNPAAEQIYGRPSSEFFKNQNLWIEVIHSEDREQVWAARHKLFETGSYEIEYRIVCPSGEIRWLHDRAQLILDANGNPSRLDGIATDITQNKQLVAQANELLEVRVQERTAALEQLVEQLQAEIKEREFQQARERFTTLVEGTADIVEGMDTVGEPIYLNPTAPIILSVGEVEDLSTNHNSAFSALPMKRQTKLAKEAEAAQARSEAKWRSLIQNSSDLITILSADSTILYESPSIERILGYLPEELVGQSVLKYIAPDDEKVVKKGIKNLLSAGHRVTLPPMAFRFLCKDGSWRFLEASGTNLLADEAVGGLVINSRDVTERFKVQEALRQSEVRFRAIFEGAALGIALSDPTGVLLTCNPALHTMLGYTDTELRQRTITHPDDVAADAHLYEALLAGSLPSYQLEKRYFHKDGHLVWGRLTVSLVRDKAAEPLFVVAMVEDITIAKQTEAALLRISKAIENASDAISIADTRIARLIYLNPAYCQMFEYTLEQLNAAGGPFILFNDPKIMHEVFAIALSGHSWQGEVEMRSRSGVIKQIALRTDAIKDATGEVVGTIAIHTDITERKQAEAALRRSYHRAELLKQITTEIRSSLDLQDIFQTTVTQVGQALKVNRCMIHLYQDGQPPSLPLVAEYLEPGHPSMQHFELPVTGNPHVERVLATDQAIASSDVYADPLLEAPTNLCRAMGIKSLVGIRTSYQGEPNGVLGLHQCDSFRNWESSEIELLEAVAAQVGIALAQARLLEKEKTTATQLAQQNLALQLSEARERTKATELEQALLELQRTQAQLVQTEKMSSLGQLVAGVAHEINNPVCFIIGNINYACDYMQDLLGVLNLYRQYYPQPAEAIQAEVKKIDLDFLIKDFPKLLSSMKVGADRINQIVLSLRNFSRHDEAEMKSVDIHEGIDSTLMILQNRLKAQGGNPEITVIKDYGMLPLVECYAGQLNQVFMNLISNAIDALEEATGKEPSLLPSIQIYTEAKGENQAVIHIKDNGAGMTEEVQQKLFNPFFTTKPMGKGTGLGLSISYQIIVEKHGGQLQCFSVPGQGTEFIIEIPIRNHPKQAA
jgi:PAS domain S-box-containing protein